jgi:hypothetical protein
MPDMWGALWGFRRLAKKISRRNKDLASGTESGPKH